MSVAVAIAILLIQNDALIYKLGGDFHCSIQVSTGIIAQVDNDTVRMLFEQGIERVTEFLGCVFAEGINIHVSDPVIQHFPFRAMEDDLSTRNDKFERLSLSVTGHC